MGRQARPRRLNYTLIATHVKHVVILEDCDLLQEI